MSYILDALTKSQQRRGEAPAPTLNTPQLMAPSPKRSRGSHGVAVALASVAVLLGVYLLVSDPRDPGQSRAATEDVSVAQLGEKADSTPLAANDGGRGKTINQSEPVRSGTELDARARVAREAAARGRRPPRLGAKSPAVITPDPVPQVSRAAPRASPVSSSPLDAAQVKKSAVAVTARRTSAPTSEAVGGTQARIATQTAPERNLSAQADMSSELGPIEDNAANLSDASPAGSSESRQLLKDLLARQRRYEDEARPSGASESVESEPGTKLARAGDGSLATPSERPAMPTGRPPEKAPLRLFELPEGLQQTALGLRINAHVYAEVPSDRLVIINMSRYREGEQIKEGPRIDAITSTGAILSYQSERFYLNSR